MRRKLIAGNWKMNFTSEEEVTNFMVNLVPGMLADVLVCPPSIWLYMLKNSNCFIGAQDVSPHALGAHTGDIAASQLKAMGCKYVIVGHSERRTDHNETDELVKQKAQAVIDAGMIAIICVGETLAQRELGITEEVVTTQVFRSVPENATPANTVIAYEPVWAIGTGKNATPDDAQAMHKIVRAQIAKQLSQGTADSMRILYGGSMKPANAAGLLAMPDIDGGLIGGASLLVDDFNSIIDMVQ
ncbi:MAG: triose-phosphate isomerase [Alphaproteobacteria bacterium]|nr:triose-phosphate isomerase [Alphaproteobacteria bacterium]